MNQYRKLRQSHQNKIYSLGLIWILLRVNGSDKILKSPKCAQHNETVYMEKIAILAQLHCTHSSQLSWKLFSDKMKMWTV